MMVLVKKIVGRDQYKENVHNKSILLEITRDLVVIILFLAY